MRYNIIRIKNQNNPFKLKISYNPLCWAFTLGLALSLRKDGDDIVKDQSVILPTIFLVKMLRFTDENTVFFQENEG